MTTVLLPLAAVSQTGDYTDLPGPYCAQRRDSCCQGRIDQCSVPILGTLCYCDDFCNRTRSEDCCPDYWRPAITMASTSNIEKALRSTAINVDQEVISGVNSAGRRLNWRATNFSTFWGHQLDEGISLRLGTIQPQKAVMNMQPVTPIYDPRSLPRSFDARNKWPAWVEGIKDQGWCGSSWALSTTAVASDRFAIMSRGLEKVQLSAQHLLACNNRGQRGCKGGYLDRAWQFLRKFGVVDEPCYPYTAGSGNVQRCRLPKRSNLLTARCSPPAHPQTALRTELYRMGPAYRLGSEQDIMFEIMESGPVQATMKVYQDFFHYQGGVYQRSHLGDQHHTGYHSVRIVGWGEDLSQYQPIKYWLVANSWGNQWGENGYFRIRRGVNECEIEEFVLAAWADTLVQTIPASSMTPNNRISNSI
ncbi:putative peptidase C1-like protein F26E4.3 [Blattella germanica]|nr:putative peptidase C1-like protein F26E4.3 [Blattella germanica]